MLAPHNWWGLISDALASLTRDTGLWILGLLFTGFLLSRRGWARKDMVRVAGQVSKRRNDTFALTIWAFALTIYLAVGWPFLMSVMILNHLALRWLTLTRHKIALKDARQKKAIGTRKAWQAGG